MGVRAGPRCALALATALGRIMQQSIAPDSLIVRLVAHFLRNRQVQRI